MTFLGLVALFALQSEGLADEPTVALVRDADGKPRAFLVSKLSESVANSLNTQAEIDRDFSTILTVSVVSGDTENAPMLGRYELTGRTLKFIPRFPLRPGLVYRATLQPDAVGSAVTKPLEFNFDLPEIPTEAADVTAVYPSGKTLPVNHLRFYLQFSQPMSRGEAYNHLRLLKADKTEIELPFLELGEELWDAEGKRLTVLIDPGRIKRGVTPREVSGPVFEAGKTYSLVVDAKWKDAEGRPLARSFTKEYQAGPAVEIALEPETWKLKVPRVGAREALMLVFPRPLDQALAQRVLTVSTSTGQAVRGRVTVDEHEQRWRFEPEVAWSADPYHIDIDMSLEDTCGNRIGRAFEIDQFRPVTRRVETESYQLKFRPLPQKSDQ